jgi:hypothetical protein
MEALMFTLVGKQAVVVGGGVEHYRDPELVARRAGGDGRRVTILRARRLG